ncbi:hypothetical protein ACHAO1_004716 [Botrytis cinerea]
MASQYPQRLALTKNSFPQPGATNSAIIEILNRFCLSINFPIRILGCSLREGGNNTIILCYAVFTSSSQDTSASPISCILRTGKLRWNRQSYTDSRILETAAFHHVMGKLSPLIPLIYAWDATCVNLLGCPYVIQPLIAGHDLQTLNSPLSYCRDAIEMRIQCAYEVARYIKHVESFRFENYGTFAVSEQMPEKCSDPSSPLVSELIGFSPKPWIKSYFMRNDTRIGNFLFAILTAHLDRGRRPLEQEKYNLLITMGYKLNELQISRKLEEKAEPAVLWHPDFWPRNIMMEKTERDVKITGVIDWDGVMIVPRVMARRPPVFLWDEENLNMSEYERKVIKFQFDKRIEELLPGYCSDAYSDCGIMARAMATYTLKGVNWNYCELSFDKLVEQWDCFVGNL